MLSVIVPLAAVISEDDEVSGSPDISGSDFLPQAVAERISVMDKRTAINLFILLSPIDMPILPCGSKHIKGRISFAVISHRENAETHNLLSPYCSLCKILHQEVSRKSHLFKLNLKTAPFKRIKSLMVHFSCRIDVKT